MFLVVKSYGNGSHYEHVSVTVHETLEEAQALVLPDSSTFDDKGRRLKYWAYAQVVMPGEDFDPLPDEEI